MKNLMNLGTILNKNEQKTINGGFTKLTCGSGVYGSTGQFCQTTSDCNSGEQCFRGCCNDAV